MRATSLAIVTTVVFLLPTIVCGQGFFEKHLIDTLDGHLDFSGLMNTEVSVLPIAVPITEPAVGIGLIGGLMYFHDRASEMAANADEEPTLSALLGGYTTNQTWLVAGYHQQSFLDDRLRASAAVAYVSVNLRFYPAEAEPSEAYDGFGFNMKGLAFAPDMEVRLGRSDFWLGLDYAYFDNELTFDFEEGLPENPEDNLDSRLSGVGMTAKYDGVDNTFTPNHGVKVELTAMRFDSLIGSTENFFSWSGQAIGYYNVSNKWIPGLNLGLQGASEDAPFYALPFVKLRGIPALRYQGELVFSGEMQHRVNFTRRWAGVFFGGYGHTIIDSKRGNTVTEDVWTYGVGFRYLLARLVNLWVGLDVARGPEETVAYIQIGKPMNWW